MSRSFSNQYSELEVGKSYLLFKKEYMPAIKALPQNKGLSHVLLLVTKYLNNCNCSVLEIRNILRSYTMFVVYYLVRDKIKEIYGDKLFGLIKNGVDSYEFYLKFLDNKENNDASNPFISMMFVNDYKDFKRHRDELLLAIKSIYRDKIENFELILKYYSDYFLYNMSSQDFDYYNHFDLMIAHILNSKENHEYYFYVNQEIYREKINKMIDEKKLKNVTKPFYVPILGHIIHTLFVQNATIFDSRKVKFKSDAYLKAFLFEKSVTSNKYKFIKTINDKESIKEINPEFIEEFEFDYGRDVNDKKTYIFTKEGIKEK